MPHWTNCRQPNRQARSGLYRFRWRGRLSEYESHAPAAQAWKHKGFWCANY